MKLNKIVSVAVAGCMVASLAACGSPASNDTASTSGATTTTATGEAAANTAGASNITVQIGPNPETLDPALNSSIDGANMIITLYEPLLFIDEDGTVQPGQAESYTVSEDGLTWTFTMKDGLKWSDGSDLTAKDFEYSFKRLADPNTAAPYGSTVVGMIAGYEESQNGDLDALQVTASEDGKTLTIVLGTPCAFFDKIAAFATMSPVQQATVEANGESWSVDPATYVCNGPYMISEWVPGERIVMAKNPNYVGGFDSSRIVTDTLTWLLQEDPTASYAAYNSGEALLIKDVPTDEIPSLTKVEDGGDFYLDPIMGTYYISMNVAEAPFDNVSVRQALSLAIDRDYVANTIMGGTYSPAYNYVGPGITDEDGTTPFMDNANGGVPYISDDYEANLAEAKALLAEAGYPDGAGFPTITYSTNDAGYHIPIAEYLQSVYAELGITMNIDTVEWSSFTPQRRAHDFQMARNGWVCDWNDPASLLELFMTGNGNNDGQISDPAYDAAMSASQTADSTAHFAALHEAEDVVMENAYMIPLAYYQDFWLQSPSLKGSYHSAYGYWYLQYAYAE